MTQVYRSPWTINKSAQSSNNSSNMTPIHANHQLKSSSLKIELTKSTNTRPTRNSNLISRQTNNNHSSISSHLGNNATSNLATFSRAPGGATSKSLGKPRKHHAPADNLDNCSTSSNSNSDDHTDGSCSNYQTEIPTHIRSNGHNHAVHNANSRSNHTQNANQNSNIDHMLMQQLIQNYLHQQHQQQQMIPQFFASLLQNPSVIQSPEIMSTLVSMLQSALGTPVNNQAGHRNNQQQHNEYQRNSTQSEAFRNFSIPNSDSGFLRSILSSCSDHTSTENSTTSRISSHSSSTGSSHSPQNCNSISDKHLLNKNSKYLEKSLSSPLIFDSKKGQNLTHSSGFSTISSDNEHHNDIFTSDPCQYVTKSRISSENSQTSGRSYSSFNELLSSKVESTIADILSDENLRKNNFLAKLFETNSLNRPQILIKRIAGFKRVKSLTVDFRVIQNALKRSTLFEVSKDGQYVIRNAPLPGGKTSALTKNEKNENRIVKKILAINFSVDDFNIERMTKIFEKIGEIAQIVLVRPNKAIPEFLVEYTQWVPDLGKKPCAIIDFETQEDAQNACREINMSNREGSSVRCALLKPGARIKRTLYRKYTTPSSDSHISTDAGLVSGEAQLNGLSSETYHSGSNNSSVDSGNKSEIKFSHKAIVNTNSSESQKSLNRKNVKKAISKHFISLGAWKNSSLNNHMTLAKTVSCPKAPINNAPFDNLSQHFGLNAQTTQNQRNLIAKTCSVRILNSQVNTIPANTAALYSSLLRQPKGPCNAGQGFGHNYRQSRVY